MKTRSRSLSITSLQSLRNARSRIYVPGSDPLFSRMSRSKPSIRVVPAFPDEEPAVDADTPLWRQEVIDRLQTPLTRYHE
jgi:hypothetical protein